MLSTSLLATQSWAQDTPAQVAPAPPTDVKFTPVDIKRWKAQRAWQWYQEQPWLCGFNYIPAHSISYTEMFMPYNFDAQKIDRELAIAQADGFHCARVVLPFVVWEHTPPRI